MKTKLIPTWWKSLSLKKKAVCINDLLAVSICASIVAITGKWAIIILMVYMLLTGWSNKFICDKDFEDKKEETKE